MAGNEWHAMRCCVVLLHVGLCRIVLCYLRVAISMGCMHGTHDGRGKVECLAGVDSHAMIQLVVRGC